ncbi:hypothetical protein Tco_0776125 [Tanacetum coccineum]
MGIMPTKTELALEQTQQGVSNESWSVLTKLKIYIKMAARRSSRVKYITTCSNSINRYKDMMKAQVHVTQVFRYSDTQNVFFEVLSVQDEASQWRLLESFQDKEKYEHVGLKVTRSQEGERLQDDVEMTND